MLIFVLCSVQTEKEIPNKKYDLESDGCTLLTGILREKEIIYLKEDCESNNYKKVKEYIINHKEFKKMISQRFGEEYLFQDYILIIKKSAIHTCHRDFNGDFFNKEQKHPSYTILIFLEDMEKCLGVIPKSHKDVNSFNVNFKNQVENVVCKRGDVLLFNSNLIHVGATNKKDNNLRLQMKITHKEDIEALSYYQKYNKVLEKDNHLPKYIIKLQKNASCMFPVISTALQSENINATKSQTTSSFQRFFSSLFYGNSRFYDLQNAF
jgi:hypothetical protein